MRLLYVFVAAVIQQCVVSAYEFHDRQEQQRSETCNACVWDDEGLNEKMKARVTKSLQHWANRKTGLSDLQANVDANRHLIELVAIIDHKVYVEGAVEVPTGKFRGWYDQLSEALVWLQERGVGVPDCMFTIHFRAEPYHSLESPPAAPSLALASSPLHSEVPYPNPYFSTPSAWAQTHRQLLDIAQHNPFARRSSQAFYRGMCRGYPGSLSRVELAAIDHHLLDVALINKCEGMSWSAAPNASQILWHKARKAGRVPLSTYANYKFSVHMPGSISGSYSRHLQFALGLGGVVLKWDSPFFEFYYDWLEDGTHFVTVNATNIVQKVAELNDLPDVIEKVASDTQEWFKRHLHPEFLQQYWWHLLSGYASLLDFRPSLSLLQSPCACQAQNPAFNGSQCEFCRIRPV